MNRIATAVLACCMALATAPAVWAQSRPASAPALGTTTKGGRAGLPGPVQVTQAQKHQKQGWTIPGTSAWLAPYAIIVGGLEVETIQKREDIEDTREDRVVTIALSRFGFRGGISDFIEVESEFEFNAGPHGTSAWEGQAALQVRNQLIRVKKFGLTLEAGRITDDSSLDFFSDHVAVQLLTDSFTRNPLLASGFNRGNGVMLRYEPIKGLRPGVTFNAGNPTSNTGSLVIGGTFPPFGRFYQVPWERVGRDASSFPQDNFHVMILTPSVTFKRWFVEAQTAVQLFWADTDTDTPDDENITGYNVRAGLRMKLFSDRLSPFANFSYVSNPAVDSKDRKKLSGEQYVGWTASSGLDFNFYGRSGVGAQYAVLWDQQGDGVIHRKHYINVGATYWLTPQTAVGARGSFYINCEDGNCDRGGEHSFFITLRAALGINLQEKVKKPDLL